MLISAFSKESDSVYVDLLTYNDLEMLKARKTSSTNLSSSTNSLSSATNRSILKRYVILTYAGEFDRVHFPLPLAQEDAPTIDSLKRTIRRLQKQLDKVTVDPNLSLSTGNVDISA